jgi:hypothetical protein
MKKLLTLAALLGMASMSFGQGTVNFFNSTKTPVRTNSVVGGPTTGSTAVLGQGPTYYFALFVAPATVTTVNGFSDPNWTFTGLYASNHIANAGVFSESVTPSVLPTSAAYVSGSTLDFFAVGWSANVAGADWASALSWYNGGNVAATGWWGASAVATGVVVGGGGQPAGTIFGLSAGNAAGFTLSRIDPVPEPTSLALAGLGAAALLIFRRRK